MKRLLLSVYTVWIARGRLVAVYAESLDHAREIAGAYVAGRTTTDAAGRPIRETSR